MEALLPTFFVAATGLCLVLVLLALWHSLRHVLGDDPTAGQRGIGGAPRATLSGAQAALVHEKDELLAAIRELRFEHELGKVNDADLQRFEQRYRTRAREVLRTLDEQLEPHRAQARELIEQALAGEAPATASAGVPATSPDASASTAAVAPSPAALRPNCPSCAASNEPDAVFCKKCGARVQPESP